MVAGGYGSAGGFNISGAGYSDQTIHLGTYHASESELAKFEGRQTRVVVVE